MLARSILIIIGVISLIWIGYASFNLLDQEKQFNPGYIFNSEDQEVLIINEYKTGDNLFSDFTTTESNNLLLSMISTEQPVKIYLSQSRNNILIEGNDYFNQVSIKELLGNPSDFEIKGVDEFELTNFSGKIYKNNCRLTPKEFHLNPSEIGITYDKNGYGSIVKFNNGVDQVIDIYQGSNGVFEYAFEYDRKIPGNKINDAEVFQNCIPSNISSYTFFERDYLLHTDSVFRNSVAAKWVNQGVVLITINGEKALITDYVLGQDPISVLYEHFQIEPNKFEFAEFKALPLMDHFPNSSNIYVQNLDDFVVIASNKLIAEKVAGDYKLGNTIGVVEQVKNSIYGGLPQRVNFRHVDTERKLTKSIHENHILTSLISSDKKMTTASEIQKTTTTNIGEAIADFYTISATETFVITKSNKVKFVDKGSVKWEMDLNGNPVGKPELIDIYANDKWQLLVTTSSSVHLIARNGEEVSGFPIKNEDDQFITQTSFYRWKGVGYFLTATNNGKVIQYDSKGRDLNAIKTDLNTVLESPVVWVSAGRPFFGIYDEQQFLMYDIERKKTHRTYETNGLRHSIKLPNELWLFGMIDGYISGVDQKGTRHQFANSGGSLYEVFQQQQNPTILIKEQNKFHLFNSKGIEWATIRVPFNEIDNASLHENKNGNLILSVIDGLENNVYLYNTNGNLLFDEKWKGRLKVELDYTSSSMILTTVIDNTIVRYYVN